MTRPRPPLYSLRMARRCSEQFSWFVPRTSGPPTSQVVAYELTGIITGDDGRRIADARVSVNFQPAPGATFTWVPAVLDATGRYSAKFSAMPGGYSLRSTAQVVVTATGYEGEYVWFRPTTTDPQQTLDVHPRLIHQISAGESVDVTVAATTSHTFTLKTSITPQ